MAGSPLKRERREVAAATQRAKTRAKRFDRVARETALRRAEEIGSSAAAAEIGVSPATLRTWRRRIALQPVSEPVSAPESPPEPQRADPISTDPQIAAEHRIRAAHAAAGEALAEVRAAISRGLAKDARDLAVVYGVCSDKSAAAEKLLLTLREAEPRINEATMVGLVRRLEGLLGDLGHSTRDARVLAAIRRWLDGPMPTGSAVVRSIPGHAVEAMPDDDGADDDLANDVVTDATVVEPSTADDDAEPGDTTITASESPDDGEQTADSEPLELVPMHEVPLDFRNRFTLGEAGQERARVAWSEKVRNEKVAAEVREKVAAEAAAKAPRRVPNPNLGKLPAGWDRVGASHSRGRGPSGRAGW